MIRSVLEEGLFSVREVERSLDLETCLSKALRRQLEVGASAGQFLLCHIVPLK